MKNKKIIIAGLFLAVFLIWPILTQARVLDIFDITYKPNVPIPITQEGSSGTEYNFAKENIVSGDFLAAYIVAIYRYAAGFVGIVAMFMLVIAAWRWLFAAGNASKIEGAKDMVSGSLIGLALIFGGQLLLSQISTDFDSIQSLEIGLPPEYFDNGDVNFAFCTGTGDDNDRTIKKCSDYQNESQCMSDICHLIEEGDFDDRCVPDPYSDSFGCMDCWNRCKCEDYGNVWYRNLDPCDCDEDGKWIDDKCEDPIYSQESPSVHPNNLD